MSLRACALALVAMVGVAASAAPTRALALSAPTAIPDEVILGFKADVPAPQRESLLAELGALRAEPLGRTGAVRVRLKGLTGSETISRFTDHPLLRYIEPNYVYQAGAVPNDYFFPQQWALLNTGQTGGTPGADIRATEAWDLSTGSSDVVIGILDSGIDSTHPDLAANLFTNPGEIPANGLDDDGNGFVDDVHGWDFVAGDNDPQDDNGHGTNMAGIAGALGNNGIGIAGACWQVRLLPLKFLNASGTGTTADAIQALDYAVGLGVPITNNSWGGGSFSQALLDAIVAADEAGMLFVTIAGGSSRNIDENPVYPACYDVPNVIVAAATTHTDSLYPPSGYGPKAVDLAAPGANILTTRPGGSYGYLSGSSMSAAYVSGALALLLARYPFLTPGDAATHLLDRVEVLPSLAGLVRTEGRLDAYRPLAELPVTAVREDPQRASGGPRPRLWWHGASGEGIQLGLYLPRADAVRLQIVDVRGRRVRVLLAGSVTAGRQTVAWDTRDERGARAASGVYLASLSGSAGTAVTRFVLVR